ncbi:hypothetical protein WA026_016574 [Henosepilachna vigintioctopunctata]|uniref:Uncharacterized protein n=1 Tax=Henosepilachna vigintioctopunctata TaxID=420089 RepID=A0AAW1V7V8_9CUCU
MKNSLNIRTNRTTELRLFRSSSAISKNRSTVAVTLHATAIKSTSGKNAVPSSTDERRPPNRTSNSRPRFLRSRTGTPNTASDSPSSLDGRHRSRPSTTNSPLRRVAHASSLGYESDDSVVKLDRATHAFIKNDIISVKTMLLKLRRVLNEQTNEDILSMSETHNPFESQSNGHFNGFSSEANSCSETEEDSGRLELMDLRRQVLFLQGQLEDKESTVKSLQEQMTKMCVDNYLSNSAPASTLNTEKEMCNAATQTERIRPVSVGPSSNGSEIDSTPGSLVSATELPRRNRTAARADLPSQRVTPTRERRKIGESPLHSARLTNNTSIPRRSESRSRVAPSTFT